MPEPPDAAKLVNRSPVFGAAAANPPRKVLRPKLPPIEANVDIPEAVNGEDEKVFEAAVLSCVPEGDIPDNGLKGEEIDVDCPRAPNGETLDPENADKLDEAKADEDVLGCSFVVVSR